MVNIKWHDLLIYHKETCEKNVNILSFYLNNNNSYYIQQAYIDIMHNMVSSHAQALQNWCFENNVVHDNIAFSWVTNLRNKINKYNERRI